VERDRVSAPTVTVDTAGDAVELTVWPFTESGGLSVLVAPSEAAVLVEELLALPRVQAAYQGLRDRGAASHEARKSRR
jgi:hypothetical protein